MAVRPLPPWYSARQPSRVGDSRVGGPTKPKFYGAPASGDTPAASGPKYIVTPGDVPPDYKVSEAVEKFSDPFYEGCTAGGKGTPYVFNPTVATGWGFDAIGYEYLASVPNNASARVAAMRAKIVANGSAPSHQVDTMVDVSLDGLRKFGLDIARRYREAKAAADAGDASQIAAIAKEHGVPVEGFLSDYKTITDLVSLYSPDSKDFLPALWRNFSPQMLAVARAVADKVKTLITGSGTEMSTALADSLAAASGVVPVAGQFVKIVIDLYSADMAARAKAAAEECQKSNDITAAYVKKTVGLSLPVPLHLLEAFPNAFSCDDAPSRFAAQSVLGANLRNMVGEKIGMVNVNGVDWGRTWDAPPGLALPWGDQEIIGWWWGLASSMMSSPEVEPVFRAMNRDVNGGAFASDEQVMIVAAPVAVAYGLNVDVFARMLWNESPGWRSRPDLFEKFTYSTLDNPSICTTVAVNAMQIQWAVLARTAYDIAERAKAGKISDLQPSLGPEAFIYVATGRDGDYIPVSTPIVFGAIGSGLLLAAGMSVPVVAIPAVVGAALGALSRWANRHPRDRVGAIDSVGRVASMGCRRCGMDRFADKPVPKRGAEEGRI